MADRIALLPDAIANQIAAGEVVQRPASAVKELLENAIDAGATKIQLLIENAGVGTIQVIDNGFGMSSIDARMSLERHATSKIKTADDLFNLNSYGFRGEALASIAAVSQMEIKTRREDDEVGTHLVVEGSKVLSQDICQTTKGTMITVRNLFFNVPARRNFLKSNSVEIKHITEEFVRVALVNPELSLTFQNGNNKVHQLLPATLEERVSDLFGIKKDELIPIAEETDVVRIGGFIGHPKIARRTRGMQYFFANQRFIRDSYLQHAVFSAYESIIEKDTFPSFFIQLEVARDKIDVNIHPTKTEVKFEDGRFIYTMLQSVVKKALAQRYHVQPEVAPDWLLTSTTESIKVASHPVVKTNPRYNPFEGFEKKRVPSKWETLYEPFKEELTQVPSTPTVLPTFKQVNVEEVQQLFNRFILAKTNDGHFLIDQHQAHVRVLYDQLMRSTSTSTESQQLLFPVKLVLPPGQRSILLEELEWINTLGFNVSPF